MNSESLKNGSSNPNEISLKDLILSVSKWYNYILSKWLITLLFVLIGGVCGFVYTWNKKPVYKAITTFVLEEDKAAGGGGLGSLAGLASIAGVDLGAGGGGIFQGDNILELYKSRSMIQRTLLTPIKRNGKMEPIVNRYIEINKLRDKWNISDLKFVDFSDKSMPNSYLTRVQDSILGVIVNEINKSYLSVVKPDKKLSIIKVEVRSNDEFFAKVFNNEIVKNVNDFYVQTKTKKSLANVRILQEKTDSVRAVMNGDIYKAAAVIDATPNLNSSRLAQRAAPVQRSQFSAETNKAILSELVKNLEMSKMALLKETPLIQVVDEPVFPLEREVVGNFKGIIVGVIVSFFIVIMVLTIRFFIKSILD